MKQNIQPSRALLLSFLLGMPSLAVAQPAASVTTYVYDARGRLVGVTQTGGRNNNVKTAISYDAADNRTQYVVTGARARLVVVPLNGYTVISLRRR